MAVHSLAGLLRVLLCLDTDLPVYASPSFARWQPTSDGPLAEGLWLLDSRDYEARQQLRAIAAQGTRIPFQVALILADSGDPRIRLRSLLRRFQETRGSRWSERRVSGILAASSIPNVMRLGFEAGPGVPVRFGMDADQHSGAAFLLSRQRPFTGPLWSDIRRELVAPDLQVLSFQLRARGAAVVMVEAGRRRYVVRLIPPGDLQALVNRNHAVLTGLRQSPGASSDLDAVLPEPVFALRHGGVLVLCETMLRGVLAWKLAAGALGPAIHVGALAFLDDLGRATCRELPAEAESIRELIQPDRDRLDRTGFVSERVRTILHHELADAERVLPHHPLQAYASHGDFGYGNVLVDPVSGEVTGIIDWDTARLTDLPGIDRVNLEIQIRHGGNPRVPFPDAVESVWRERAAHPDLLGPGGPERVRALFGLGVCRFITRTMNYPEIYGRLAGRFERTVEWLARTGADSE